MSESFLHYIWKHQYFEKKSLRTVAGDPVAIFDPGYHNTDAGPDFKEAALVINDMEWRGQVEIHHRSSDWDIHGHQHDKAYNGTVLHVVWKDDELVKREDGTKMPTVELHDRVDLRLQRKYNNLIKNGESIPCAPQINVVNSITKLSVLDKTVLERLEGKAEEVKDLLEKNSGNWEETAFQLLARSFGFKINSEPFFNLAKSIPYKILKKHADHVLQVEALLFGQAGFLSESYHDEYFNSLKKEYGFLRKKYDLKTPLSAHHWKYLRLRPANFPTLRITQFSTYIASTPNLFTTFLEEDDTVIIKKLRSDISSYWQHHYKFDSPASKKVAGLGISGAQNICINTVAPLLVAYSHYIDDQQYLDKAIALLQALKAEKNHIVDKMKSVGFEVSNAFDTQGLIALHNNYCMRKKCLQCAIGASLVRP